MANSDKLAPPCTLIGFLPQVCYQALNTKV